MVREREWEIMFMLCGKCDLCLEKCHIECYDCFSILRYVKNKNSYIGQYIAISVLGTIVLTVL